jgi:hypothetical protein
VHVFENGLHKNVLIPYELLSIVQKRLNCSQGRRYKNLAKLTQRRMLRVHFLEKKECNIILAQARKAIHNTPVCSRNMQYPHENCAGASLLGRVGFSRNLLSASKIL